MRLLHEIAIFQTVISKVIISLFKTVRLSVSISLINLYNSLNSIKEMMCTHFDLIQMEYSHKNFNTALLLVDMGQNTATGRQYRCNRKPS